MNDLLAGQVWILKRDRRQAGQALRMPSAEFGNMLVLHAHDLGSALTIRPVVVLRGRRTDDLHVHAHAIHVGKPLVQPRQLRSGLRQHDRIVVGHRSGTHGLEHHLRLGRLLGRAGDERFGLRGQYMAVQVDREWTLAKPCLDRPRSAAISSRGTDRMIAEVQPHGVRRRLQRYRRPCLKRPALLQPDP